MGEEGEEPGRRRRNNRLAHNFQIIIFPRVLFTSIQNLKSKA